jgi:hypothetical protein
MSTNQRQRRPLSGIVPTGILTFVSEKDAHVFDNSPASLGGPYMDEVTLDVCNPAAAPQMLRVVVGGGGQFDVEIPAATVFRVFDAQPFRRTEVSGDPSKISVANVTEDGTDMVAWGFFTRG